MERKKPSLTVDGILLNEKGEVLLIKRKREPFKNFLALPGGFVEYGERVEDAIIREMMEETGLEVKIEKLFGVYSDPLRDPRGHTVSIVYVLKKVGGNLKGGDDAEVAKVFKKENLPQDIAFDHRDIIEDYYRSI